MTTNPPVAADRRDAPAAANNPAATEPGCRYPERCGSDGETCCHYECWFSHDQQMRREHIKALAAKAWRNRGR